jgi:membrane-bound inhibitor of C-type lysozyme
VRRTVGAKRVEQLNDNLGAVDVVLTDEDLCVLDGVSAIPAEYRGWVLNFWSQACTAQLAASCA